MRYAMRLNDSQREFLKENYETTTVKELSERFKLPGYVITHAAKELGLSKNNPWLPHELNMLLKMTDKEALEAFPTRTVTAIRARRNGLRR